MGGGPAVMDNSGIGANAPKNKLAGVAVAAFAAFGGILYGYDTGIISGIQTMEAWLKQFGHPVTPSDTYPNGYGISSGQQSLVVSILSVGTFFGSLAGAPVADIIGRKLGIIFSCLVFCAGVAMQTASVSLPLFIAGRVIAGLGVGLISTLVPMYQSECAPKWVRGAVVSGYQWAITIGLLLANIVNNATQSRQDASAYRIPISLQFIWAFVLASGMTILPESPRWLVKKRRDAAAAKALARLTSLDPGSHELEAELSELRSALQAEEALGNASYLDCFRESENKMRLRTLTAVGLQALQQLSGVNFVFYYGTTFFKQAGISNAFLISIATGVVNVGMTIPGIWGVERFGRRTLLLLGAAGMCISELLVAIIGVSVSSGNKSGQQALIAFVCIYIAFFAATWGPVAWVVTGEIFPLALRAKGVSLAASSNWLWNFGIGYATPYLVNSGKGNANLGSKVYFIWGGMCAIAFAFAFVFVPETKGLSLEQVDLLYRNTTPLRAAEFRKRILAGEVPEPGQGRKMEVVEDLVEDKA
ncbi:general substrate transporter [Vararia minispora EC-137]|uniref:General substrate transporter n=1 Tax=Vararia minispora EC-137 TaxID=1314806 RepID=A0ACB8QL27_9AGAM|nr:general substrate transporter [Vararia minispora EC-137]